MFGEFGAPKNAGSEVGCQATFEKAGSELGCKATSERPGSDIGCKTTSQMAGSEFACQATRKAGSELGCKAASKKTESELGRGKQLLKGRIGTWIWTVAYENAGSEFGGRQQAPKGRI